MSYRGLKWLKFNFVIHPNELKEIFEKLNYFIVITNQRVEENYQVSDKDWIFDKYHQYYSKIISGEKWTQEEDVSIDTSITDNLKLIKYEKFKVEEDGIQKTFKRAIQLKPVINVTTFSLVIDYKDRLSVAFYEPKSNLGIQLNYPKEIYNFETDENIKTEKFSTYKLYKELVKSVKKISKKACVERNGKRIKPNFWISEKAINDINNNYSLKKNNIKLLDCRK